MIKKIKNLYNKYEEIISYLFFGVLTTIVSVLTYLLFANTFLSAKTDLDIQISNVLSWICAVAFAYITNRKYVFKSKTKGKEKTKEATSFVLARVTSLIADMALMYIMFSLMHINDTVAKLIVQVVVTIMNYILSKIMVFKKEKVD
ncbi:MAG: GtrA family protein [Oscillospiraceae bacterium]|jgi:putative flippase GtrA